MEATSGYRQSSEMDSFIKETSRAQSRNPNNLMVFGWLSDGFRVDFGWLLDGVWPAVGFPHEQGHSCVPPIHLLSLLYCILHAGQLQCIRLYPCIGKYLETFEGTIVTSFVAPGSEHCPDIASKPRTWKRQLAAVLLGIQQPFQTTGSKCGSQYPY